jgi:heme/copper-type cytochrome/quinol oxidase subunit 3
MTWLWTGTAPIPEARDKEAGSGRRIPLYVSGPSSTGWWAMFITMTGDLTAFLSLIFGYFFFWTIHEDFPPDWATGPGWEWPLTAALLALASWGATLAARIVNRARRVKAARLLLAIAPLAALAAGGALLAGPWLTDLDPTAHAYPAIVWALALWTALHLATGALMQGYVLARSIWGRMTPEYDADIWNVTLYWHFAVFGALMTAATIGGFPLVS